MRHRLEATRPKPNLLDRAVNAVAPIYGAKRLAARWRSRWIYYGRGGYEGGRFDHKGLQEDLPDVDSAKSALHPNLWTLRARSRDYIRNAPVASGAVRKVQSSVVGCGLQVQPQIDRDALGLTDDQADTWEREALAIFRAWSKPDGGCDIAMEHSFETLQNIVVHEVLAAGDVLSSFRWRPKRGAPFGSAIQLIPAERVSNPKHQPDTTALSMGVETNRVGRVLAYHVNDDHPGEVSAWDNWRRVAARNVLNQRVARLVYDADRLGGVRGVPFLAAVITQLRQLTDYSEAELQAAVLSALFTVFVKTETPGAGPLMSLHPTYDYHADSDGGIAEDQDVRLGKGSIHELAPGEDIALASMTRPNAEYDPFVQSLERHIGMAVEVPYEVLVQHFSSSYSASRAALQEAWRTFRRKRFWLSTYFCQPAYELVLGEAVMTGLLKAPGFFSDPIRRAAWTKALWTGEAPGSVDPVKDANAAKIRVDEGFSTGEREARELTGTDFGSNMRKRRREAAELAEIRETLAPAADDGMEDGEPIGAGSGRGNDGDGGDDGD